MNELITTTTQLPDTLEDLSKFVLVAQEKVVAVRAEIRAIQSLKLAKEVEEQKKAELRDLSETLLDAQVLIGEMTRKIPCKAGERTDLQPSDTVVARLKTKQGTIADLGLSQKQVERFETLAKNKDLVEQVKSEARENDDIPTRSRVLDLAKARKQKKEDEERSLSEYSAYLDKCKKLIGKLQDLTYDLSYISLGHEELKMVGELLGETRDEEEMWIEIVEEDIGKLQTLLKFLKGRYK